MRHVHRFVPFGEPVRFYQCHCGKTQKAPPPNWRDVAARRKIAREARVQRETEPLTGCGKCLACRMGYAPILCEGL